MREIEVLVEHLTENGQNFFAGPSVTAIPNLQSSDMQDANNFVVTPLEQITIDFDYPLDHTVTLAFENAGGFTALDFLRCVHEGYSQIYQEEEAAVGDPGVIPGMYNRGVSTGPHGIWGHYMEDLWFEGATEIIPGHFSLMIGS